MDATSLQPAIDHLKANWAGWFFFLLCLLSVIYPRAMWGSVGDAWKYRDGVRPEPSTAWLWSTRLSGMLVGAVLFLFLRYGKPTP
jgi:hypothetical protein